MEVFKTASKLIPINSLLVGKKNFAGRTSSGRQSFFHQGGGRKLRYRLVDLRRMLVNVPAIVRRFEYDPNRNVPLALLAYYNETLSYILAPKGLVVNDIIYSVEELQFDGIYHLVPGSAHFLKNFAVGSFVHNLQLHANGMAQYMRSYNAAAQILRKYEKFAILKLKSGEHRTFALNSIATLGVPDQSRVEAREPLRKAGLSRRLNRRPNVRGCAMNPVDHPHGGGAAKGGAKRGAFSPWGKFSKGTRTAKYKLVSKRIVKSRRHA